MKRLAAHAVVVVLVGATLGCPSPGSRVPPPASSESPRSAAPVEPRPPHHLGVGSGFACIVREARVLCTGVLPWAAEHHARTFSDIDEVDDVVEIAVDDQTLCALTTRGDVWCRSPGPEHHDDRWLRLGDGIRIAIGGDRLAIARRGARLTVAPLDATEPPSDIRPFDATADLAASLGVACGLSGSGRLLCRGTHAGSESGLQFPAPARAVAFDLGVLQVLEAEGVVREQDFVPSPEQAELTAGPYTDPIRAVFSSCALREDGSAQCPSRSGRLWTQLPAGLVTGPRIVEVARNFTTACALDDRDQLYCWGDDDGILGVRTEARRVEDVVGVTDAIDVVVGENHGCALLRNGEVRCWGGPFGAPTRAIVGLDDMLRSPIRALASTDLMVCALGAGGDVVCWGRRWPTRDEDLEGPEGHRPLVPLTLVPMPRVDEITAAMSHMCARAEGHVSCWRDGAPAEIGALAGADHIAGSGEFLCGVVEGVLRCAALEEREEEDVYPPPTDPRAVGAVDALVGGIGIVCWATRETWTCASRDADRAPTAAVLAAPRDLALTAHRSCAVSPAGVVQCVGVDADGNIVSQPDLAGMMALPWLGEATHIALELNHGCVVLADGRVRCWGPAGEGALGGGHFVDVEVPTRVGDLEPAGGD